MRIAVVVMNNVTGDSRVQKIATSAAARGHEVLVIGTSDRRATGAGVVGGAPVVRVVSPSRYYAREALRDIADRRHAVRAQRHEALMEHLKGRAERSIGWRVLVSTAARLGTATERAHELRAAGRDAVDRGLARMGARLPALWRVGAGQLVDYENALLPVLLAFAPDAIHVNDPHPLSAALEVRNLLAGQRAVTVVYDAHEWWEGVSDGGSAYQVGLLALERTCIRQVDHVVTVTEEIASRLEHRYRLPRRPVVLRNVPRAGIRPTPGRRPLREEVGLADGVPLLVYSGTLLRRRGVHDIVAALRELPGCHLALVAPPRHPSREELTALAAELGVADRLYVTDFVPAESVAWYLADATLGISALVRSPHHDLAAPTKLAEYVHAGLPLVVSDCTTQARFVTSTGTGAVFRAGEPADLAAAARRALADLEGLRHRVAQVRESDPMDWEAEFDGLAALYPPPAAPVRHTGTALVFPADDLLTLPWEEPPLVVRPRRGEPDMAVALTRVRSLADRALVVSDTSPICFAGIGTHPWQALELLRAWGVATALVARSAGDVPLGADRNVPVLVRDPREEVEHPGTVWWPVAAGTEALDADIDTSAPVAEISYAADLDTGVVERLRDALAARGTTLRPATDRTDAAPLHVGTWTRGPGEQRLVDLLAAGTAVVVPAADVPPAVADRPVVVVPADGVAAAVTDLLDRPDRLAALRAGARAYARSTHSPAAVLARLRALAAVPEHDR